MISVYHRLASSALGNLATSLMTMWVNCRQYCFNENGPASSYSPVTVGTFYLGDVFQAGQTGDGGDLVSEYLEDGG